MRLYVFIISLTLTLTILNGQSDNWKSIGSAEKTNILVLHLSRAGDIFAMNMQNGDLLYYKNEQWIFIHNTLPHFTKFYENADGDVFFTKENELYKFNKEAIKFEVFIHSEHNIRGVSFTNDCIIVANSHRILAKYDKHQRLIATNQFPYFIVKLFDIDKEHYIIYSINKQWIICDLSDDLHIKGAREYDANNNEFYYSYKNNYKNSEILAVETAIKNSHSFNGSWLILLCKSDTDKFYFLTSSRTLISTEDYGNTFSEVQLPFSTNNTGVSSESTFAIGDDWIIMDLNHWQANAVYFSKDGGRDWKSMPNNLALPYTIDVCPGVNENLVIKEELNWYLKSNSSDNWIKLEREDTINKKYLWAVEPLMDQNYLVFYRPNIFEKWDMKGNIIFSGNIDVMPTNVNPPSNNFLKYNRVILYDIVNLVYSDDNGETWSKEIFGPELDLSLKYTISRDLVLYSYHNNEKSKLSYYLPKNRKKKDFEIPDKQVDILYIETAFKEEKLFILGHIPEESKIVLYETDDLGRTFLWDYVDIEFKKSTNYKIKVFSDDIILIFCDDSIILSRDGVATWQNIKPNTKQRILINDAQMSADGYLYISTVGEGVMKYMEKLM